MSDTAASTSPANKQQWHALESLEKEADFLQPVPPYQSGEGFPYAPTDWPNPGDTWGWRVGGRISGHGYYTDRTLYPPRSLQKPARPKYFASRRSLEVYIQKEFPRADMDAFFASFIWRIPSTLPHSKKVQAAHTSPKKVEQESKEETIVAVKRKTKHTAAASSAKRQTRVSRRQSVPIVKKDMDGKIGACSLNKETETSSKCITSDFKDNQPDGGSNVGEHSPLKSITENFDSYLNSLDEIFVQPLFEPSLANATTMNSATQEDTLAEAPILKDEKAKVMTLRREYNETKGKLAEVQTELDSNYLAINEIDNQIAKLQSERVELMSVVDKKKKTKAKLSIDQEKLANAIQVLVHEVQLANSKDGRCC